MIRSSNSMSGWRFATSRATSRNRPSENFMMLALWAAVTFLRPFSSAYSKADSTIRSDPNTEIGLIEMPDSVARGRVELVGEEPAQLLDLVRALLELDAGVEVLGVLAHDHDVGVREARAHALVGLAGPDAGVQVELLAQGHVDRAVAGADRGGRRALDGEAALADGIERAIREWVALLLVDIDARVLEVPVELDAGGLEYSLGRLRELWPGAVARDEGDAVCQDGPFVE